MPGSSMSPSALPSRSNSFELRAGIVLILRQEFSVDNAGALQNAVRLRNNFLPVGARGIGRVHHEQMEVRRALIGGDVNLAAENFAVVVKILAAGEFERRRSGFQVLQKKFVLAGRTLDKRSAAASGHRRRAAARPGSLLSCGPRPRSAGLCPDRSRARDRKCADSRRRRPQAPRPSWDCVRNRNRSCLSSTRPGRCALASILSGSSLPVAVSIKYSVLFSEPLAEVP